MGASFVSSRESFFFFPAVREEMSASSVDGIDLEGLEGFFSREGVEEFFSGVAFF